MRDTSESNEARKKDVKLQRVFKKDKKKKDEKEALKKTKEKKKPPEEKNKLEFMNLRTGQKTLVDRLSNFKFSGDSKWIAYKLIKPEKEENSEEKEKAEEAEEKKEEEVKKEEVTTA